MVIYEADVPGVGKRFDVEVGDEERLVVIVHHDGRREIYRRDHPDADAEKLFDLSSSEARQVANVLQGADFQPLDLDEVDVPLGNAFMEWVEIPDDSPLTGETIADAKLREQTGTTVVAIQRDDETIGSPEPDTVLSTGDILVVIGSREEQRALDTLLETGSVENA
ncbi:potassium transporter TrkA [Halobacterium sp. DL1]|jgi:TrkA domain protein|nr:potassium transporter TrkA [Halobacterium sp. DL1]